ncbi:GlxA family transcriptional regulator [Sulfitobacter guttiformis]|jgi:transcriptional regulator GlxA family with amidase domain|uniref:AraC family transcriptional regulator with amidase-like domain n=1 Tax=Sulfitobacter guttiformis TaxID=74349 RepID=A0A420DPR7_9RHOB|nr:GlxA family transcriptional regulator [Sulfitobacter guttiformis]KIN73531.1 DJ-1/PfpI family [Sulfitobacter guttiformis KCTC 32187]RKE96180.1 AraC family transcriptional regulator with amidase-like domain [Sulfitobacter guttiformis]
MDASSNIVAEIGLLIYPNCQLAAIYGLTDLFRIAGDWPQQKNCTERRPCIRVSHWGSPPDVRQGAANRLVCLWDSYAEQPHDLSYIIAPPSIVMPEDMLQMPAEAEWLTDRHAEGSKICSVCAGAFVLAESGLIDGRRVTTHWAFADLLSRRFPKIDAAAQDMVLDDGDILTAGGILAWTDLGLTLVDRLMGPSAMLATAKFLLIDPPGRQQLPYHTFNPRFDHGDEAIVRVQHHVHAHAADQQSVRDLATVAKLGERTFLRKFTKCTGLRPTQYVQQVRVAKAREMLETTQRPVDQISWQVGYRDPAAFRKVFLRLTGMVPQSYRQRFGVGS